MRSDAAVRAQPERDVAVGCAVEDDLVGPVELGFVVVGREPAEDDPVVLSQALAAEDDVVSDCAAEGLVDREVAQELVGGGAVELGMVDELLSEVGVGAQVP